MRQLHFEYEPSNVDSKLDSLQYYEGKKDWMQVVQILDALVQNPRYSKALATAEDGREWAVAAEARRRLLTLPPVALNHYRRLREVDARLRYEKAGQSEAALKEIVEAYPVPKYLAKAALDLVGIYIEDGRMEQAQQTLKDMKPWSSLLSKSEQGRLEKMRAVIARIPQKDGTLKRLRGRAYLILGPLAVHWLRAKGAKPACLEGRDLRTGARLWRQALPCDVRVKIVAQGTTVFVRHYLGLTSIDSRTGWVNWSLRWGQLDKAWESSVHLFSPDIQSLHGRLIVPFVYLDQKLSAHRYTLVAIDQGTGKRLWTRHLARMKGASPSQFSTTLVSQTLYAVTDDGLLAALNANSGETHWRRRYMSMERFNQSVHWKSRSLRQAAPNLVALRRFGSRLYFYNAFLQSFYSFELKTGRRCSEKRLKSRAVLADFTKDHPIFNVWDGALGAKDELDWAACPCHKASP